MSNIKSIECINDTFKKILSSKGISNIKEIIPLYGGISNDVYEICVNNKPNLVLKIGDKNALTKEKWCSDQARSVGVKTIEIYEISQNNDITWSLQRKIEGSTPTDQDKTDLIYFELGKTAKTINSIETGGCGFKLSETEPYQFTHSWKDTISWQLDWVFNNAIFLEKNLFDIQEIQFLKDFCVDMVNWEFTPCLAHSDLALKNTIISDCGDLYILDWGSALGHHAPVADIGNFFAYHHDNTCRERFVEGYGLTSKEVSEYLKKINQVTILEAFGTVVWGYENSYTHHLESFVTNARKIFNQITTAKVLY